MSSGQIKYGSFWKQEKISPNSGDSGAKTQKASKQKKSPNLKTPGISEAIQSRYLFANDYAEKGRIPSKHLKACQEIVTIPLINHFLHQVWRNN